MKIKPLVWDFDVFPGDAVKHRAKSALHDYNINYDDWEKQYYLVYVERLTGESGGKYFKELDEAKEWAEKVHYKSKLSEWIDFD